VSINSNSMSWTEALYKNVTKEIMEGTPNIHELFIGMAEKALIEAALLQSKGRRADASNILGIGRNTITRKIKELNIKK
jgi:two-component system nitrogen regulation response regulator GlnG